VISSRDNARVKRWARLQQDARLRREEGKAIVEGPHLVAEALQAGLEPLSLLVSESGLRQAEIQKLLANRAPVVLSDSVFKRVADADTPPGIAAEIAIPQVTAKGHCVFLEGVQDPSNVGAILRTSAAFGVGEVVLDRGCADAWAPKTLRAGMGGHFKLAIRQIPDLAAELDGFGGKLLCTVLNGGTALREAELKGRLGWIFGGEGRGISEPVVRRTALRVMIPMSPETESLNVAAAAAICLYEAFSRQKNYDPDPEFSRPGAGS
jgi:TrmH family RNA methyltransferase